ncbi:Non-catalytic module family DOC2, partial [Piromyces sp. E2]
MQFNKINGKNRLTIKILDVESYEIIDGPYIFEKPISDTFVAPEPIPIPDCWSESLGYSCCENQNQKPYMVDESGPWGFENGQWCGL